MIDHMELPSADLDRSSSFYASALRQLGYRLTDRKGEVTGFHCDNGKDFWIRQNSTAGALVHFAFRCGSRHDVDTAFEEATRAGGRVKQAPTLMPQVHANYYSAQFYDPDGYLVEFACHEPA